MNTILHSRYGGLSLIHTIINMAWGNCILFSLSCLSKLIMTAYDGPIVR